MITLNVLNTMDFVKAAEGQLTKIAAESKYV